MDACNVAWILLVLILLRMLYWYLMKPFNYWKERGIPSVPAIPLLGSVGELCWKPIRDVLCDRYQKYGRIHGFYEYTRPILVVADPDLLGQILVKDFAFLPHKRDFSTGEDILNKMFPVLRGKDWKRVRALVTPGFSAGKIKKIAETIRESAMTTAKQFEKYAESGEPVDFKRLFGAYALDVISRTAFSTALNPYNDPENDCVRVARQVSEFGLSLKFLIYFIFPGLLKLFRASFLDVKPLKYFERVFVNIIKQRKETGKVFNDVLQLMIEANDPNMKSNHPVVSENEQQDEKDDAVKNVQDMEHEEHKKDVFHPTEKNKRLAEDELIAQCVLFLLANFETSSLALSFASYQLALNPECQEKLIKEVDDVLRKHEGNLTYDTVQSMQYLEGVVLETLRIQSPESFFERVAARDCRIGDTGITIEKGMVVQIPLCAIHHDPEFYENPEVFNPDRFSPEAKAKRKPYTFLPFGGGPRGCLGQRLAVIETKFSLAVLMSRFRFKRCAETKVPLEFRKGGKGLLVPHGGVVLVVEKRKDSMACA